MPAARYDYTADTLRDLAEVVGVPAQSLPGRLSELLMTFVPHEALIILAADSGGGHRRGSGDDAFVEGVSFLTLDERRRTEVPEACTAKPPARVLERDTDGGNAFHRTGNVVARRIRLAETRV